jgi:purine nucleosidase
VLIDRIRAEPGGITLCPVGPMTNIALALVKAPDIAPLIREIVFMGGAAFKPGNSTPAAEFNFMIDPHAAQIMLTAGVPMTMFGLDVTHQAVIKQAGRQGRARRPRRRRHDALLRLRRSLPA